MDAFGLFWIPDFLIWIMLTIVVLYVYGTWPFSKMASLGYKGPNPKPFFGNIDLIFGRGHFGAWDLTGKQQYGKVFAMYEGRQPTVVVFDTDILKQILVKEFSNFMDRREIPFRGEVMVHSLMDLQGAEWKRVRSLNSPFFTTGKLKRNIQLLNGCMQNLEAQCEKSAQRRTDMNVKDVMGSYTLEAICLTAFGLHVDSQNDPNHKLLQTMKKTIDTQNQSTWMFWLAFTFPFVVPFLEWLGLDMWPAGSFDTFTELTRVAIEERKLSKKEQPDFIQAMIKAHEVEVESESEGITPDAADRGKALTEIEIVAQVALFLGGGYDTVSLTLAFLLFNLADNQECQEKLLQEIQDVIGDQEMTYENLRQMTYLDICLEESMRLYPPFLRTYRTCLNDITINGFFIPKDTLISVPIFGLHRDPELWTEPEKFDPERFSVENRKTIDVYSYMPFGLGPRNCVGMRLAQIEVKMAVITVLKRFRIRVSKRTKLPVKLIGLSPTAEGGLWLEFEQRPECKYVV